MISIKNQAEIERMRQGGRITATALQETLAQARPGVSLLELEKIARETIVKSGGEPAFERVKGYRFTTCLNLNEGVVHGIPTERKLVEGDLLSVDLGTFYKGLNTDASWTVLVDSQGTGELGDGEEKKHFLKAGEEALGAAIAEARPGRKILDISAAMQRVIENAGYMPVDTLVGHGVGKELHEEPQIPCLVTSGSNPEITVGMTLAIEVIYTRGSRELQTAADGWTIETVDKSWSGLFEHTVAVTAAGPIILTKQG